ncbi:MAG TPA: MFS transporter [Gemmatimonadales bacterium]|nr:MFS transporter [Gemmatimonadales bacterium]
MPRLRLADAKSSRAYALYVLILLTLVNLLNYLDRNVVYAVFEPIKTDLKLSDAQLGWLGSAYIVVLSLAALPLGVIGDLRSRRSVITWGVAVWSASTAAGGFVRKFWQLFTCRALVGFGEAGYGPASQAIIAQYYKGRPRAFAIGVYSVGMALGGVLGIWFGGVIAERYGWRWAFIWMGFPGLVLAMLASRLRELDRRPPPPIVETVRRWWQRGMRGVTHYAMPLAICAGVGALLAGFLSLFERIPSQIGTALFGIGVSIGIAWTVWRLVPLAVKQTTQAGAVAAGALDDFQDAAVLVLRTPTLIWVFLGGAMVTFAVNGLIAWAAAFMQRVHGLSVAQVGGQFGLWALAGGMLGALSGGRLADRLHQHWPGGRVLASGAGFVLGAPICVALLMVQDLRWFAPLILATYFFYTWYNGPLVAVILDVVPPAVQASVLGAFVLFSHLAGDALAPPLIGYLSDRTGSLRTAMLLLPAVGVLGGVVILIGLTTVRRDMLRMSALDIHLSNSGGRRAEA